MGRARDAGWSWDEIGQLLGITRQGARQRYGRAVVHKAAEEAAVSTDWASARHSADEWAMP